MSDFIIHENTCDAYRVRIKINIVWVKYLSSTCSDETWHFQEVFFFNLYMDIHDLYMNNVKKEPTTAHNILEQSIWLNEQITINNKCIHWKSWKNVGIFYINDIINPSN